MTVRETKIDNIVKYTCVGGTRINNIDGLLETLIITQPNRKPINKECKNLMNNLSSNGLELLNSSGQRALASNYKKVLLFCLVQIQKNPQETLE